MLEPGTGVRPKRWLVGLMVAWSGLVRYGFGQCTQDCVLRAVAVIEAPLLYVDSSKSGEDMYYGYSCDVMDAILIKLSDYNLSVEIYETIDSQYGQNINGVWTGMVGELMYGRADIGFVPMHATAEQNTVIDFTFPLFPSSLRILVLKDESLDLFSFLLPFDVSLWFLIITATCVVAISAFFIDWMSPYGYHHSKNPNERHLWDAERSLTNSLEVAVGLKALKGKSFSTRVLILIIVSSYTANLASMMTVTKLKTDIETIDDLKTNELPFAVMNGSAGCYYFHLQENRDALQNMVEFPDVIQSMQALEAQEVCALVFPTPILDYVVGLPPCNVMEVGDSFATTFYGLPFPKGSPLRDTFSQAILELQDDGTLDDLYNKWYVELSSCGVDETSFNSLSVKNFGGPFIFLAIFLVVSISSLVVEHIWNAKSSKVKTCLQNKIQHKHYIEAANDASLQSNTTAVPLVDRGNSASQTYSPPPMNPPITKSSS
ncbi:glutamate receptor ionotropic, delta-2 [Pelomyxa schiedti]|nr:glutamate receptor ionotropic, delta-2 [Pelomyxa schiedti]